MTATLTQTPTSAPRRMGGATDGRGRGPEPGPPRPKGRKLFGGKVRDRELTALCQHLAALSGSGISLSDCLHTFVQECPKGALKRTLQEVNLDLEAGRKLSDAFDRHPQHFSPYFRASVWAGEASGNMAETLDRLSKYLVDKQETRQRVRNAFAYPVVLSFVIVGVVTFLMLYVVPIFAGVYKKMGVQLPLATQVLVKTSDVLLNQPWVLVAPALVAGGFAVWVKKTKGGRMWMDRWKVRLPLVGPLARQMTLNRFTRAFGEMMGAGVPVLQALDLAGRVTGNVAFDKDLEIVRADVQRGQGLTEPLRRTGWFSPSLLQVISTGEQSGRVPALLGRAADILEREADMTLKRVVGRVEPLLTVAMAAIVGLVLLAVYLPMFDVMQHVGK